MSDENTQLPAPIQEEIQKVEGFGMELNVAETIASYYATFLSQAKAEGDKLKGLSAENPEDVEKAKRIRLDLGKICSAVGERKKQDKAMLLIQTRYIDGLFKVVEGFARITQKEAEDIEKHAEKQEELRLDEVEKKRNETLVNLGVDPTKVDARNMIDEVWDIYIKGVHDAYTKKKQEEAEAEAKRIEEERKQKIFDDREKLLLPFEAFAPVYELTKETSEDEFKEMLAGCEKLKVDAIEKQKAQEAENERLKKEAEAREAKIKAENEAREAEEKKKRELTAARTEELKPYIVFIRDYNALIESDEDSYQKQLSDIKKAKSDQDEFDRKKAQEEAEKAAKEKEAREKAEAEAERLKKEKEAREAKEKADQEAEAKAKREAEKAPELEKIKLSLEQCVLNSPNLDDSVMKETFDVINDKFEGFKKWAADLLAQAE